jgi:hypothetical protein
MRRWLFLVLMFSLLFVSALSWGWDGPPQEPGAVVAGLFRPTNFLDGSLQGVLGNTPLTDSRFRANYVLLKGDRDTVQANARIQRFHLGEDLPLAGSPVPVPHNLWTMDAGLGYMHRLESGGDLGLNVSGGSNSDRPFNSRHELNLSVTGLYRLPVDPLHAWIFSLSYAVARSFAGGRPFPGIAYFVRNPDANIQMLIGIPTLIAWQPTADWNFRLLYIFPTHMSAEASYRFYSSFKAHVGFDWLSQAWLRADRPDPGNRLIFDQKKATAGVRFPIGEDFMLDLFGGYAFDQKIFEARSIFAHNVTKTDLAPGTFLEAEVGYRF